MEGEAYAFVVLASMTSSEEVAANCGNRALFLLHKPVYDDNASRRRL